MKIRNLTQVLLIPLLMITAGTAGRAEPTPRPDPARFANDIEAFARRDRETPPASGVLLFVGSSSIRKWDLEKSWPGRATLNNGFGGSTLNDSLHHFDRVITPYSPSAIVIYAGENDVFKGLDAEETRDDFVALVERIAQDKPGVPVIFICLKPSIKRWEEWPEMKKANALIAEECRKREFLHFVDIATPMLATSDGTPNATLLSADDLHLSEAGYALWTRLVDPHLPSAGP